MYNLFCLYSVLSSWVSSHSYPNKLAIGGQFAVQVILTIVKYIKGLLSIIIIITIIMLYNTESALTMFQINFVVCYIWI